MPGSGTCPRNAACTRGCGSASSWSTSASCAGARSLEVGRVTDLWLERLGVAGRATSRVDELSHGNQQRVQLVAALVNEPDLLVLDEPFSGLDPIAMTAMAGLLQELAGTGVTVLFSSHQLDLVEDLCEDVVIIDRGRVVLAGDLQQLRAATPQRVVDIRYHGPAPQWSGLPEAEVLERTDGSIKLKVPRDTEIPALLAQMPRHDAVTSFSYQPPSLSDLFKEAVRDMTAVNQGWLVARREMRERARSRGFRISTLLMLLVVIAMVVLPGLLDTSDTTKDVGVSGARSQSLDADALQPRRHGRHHDPPTPVRQPGRRRAGTA